ncbi:MAG: GMC family oxidoreductase N-terminal domain-containing protein [Acidimicrobiales bacterium]
MDERAAGRALEVLSRPLEDLQPHYEIVVVGSGYGGAIAACRLARAGRRVALLERGREIHPGEYPSTADHAMLHLQCVTGKGHLGDRRALFNLHGNGEINVLSGCGLGGTSLINANVSLRPSQAVLDDERWPAALRADGPGLDAAYDRAEEILQPRTYPESFPPLGKIAALRKVAAGRPFALTPINVTFAAGANAVGIHQEACNGCGDCVTGCNVGAKNTLLMNYLPDAVAHGAEVFSEIEVRTIEHGSESWIVNAQPLGLGRDGFGAPPLAITADRVVLSAGTLGTTGILLRSAAAGLRLSGRLGERFSGNGDVLGFAVLQHDEVHAVGVGPHAPDPEIPVGPCITSIVENAGAGPQGRQMIIEDAVIPGALAPLVPGQLAAQTLPHWLRGQRGEGPLAMLESLASRGRHGEMERLQTFLVMGDDGGSGQVELDGEEVKVAWPGVGISPYYEAANRSLEDGATAADGHYLHDPIWAKVLDNDLITVHPLGGCVMADSAETGVVDDRGRVFSGVSGPAVHEGLYVWDGSVIPTPLGVNPLLTISAITERAVALLAAESGWPIDYDLAGERAIERAGERAGAVGQQAPPLPATRPGLRFTEKMSGHWSESTRPAADIEDYRQAAAKGSAAGDEMAFVLTLAAGDLDAELSCLATGMTATGTVQIPGISGEPLTVDGGTFQLLVSDDTADTDVRHMRYHLPLVATDSKRYHFEGFKVVRPGTVADLWPDTSTLYATLRSHGPDGAILGLGVLRIGKADFARQLRTMQVTGPVSLSARLKAKIDFGRAFAGPLVKEYGSLLPPSKRLAAPAGPAGAPPGPVAARRTIDAPAPTVYPLRTADNKTLRLTRYQGGTKGPVVLSHGMGSNPGLFSLSTIQPNLLEYLTGHGYDVWLQEWRASTWLPIATEDFTGEDVVRNDFPAAEQFIQAETGKADVHWVAHCVAGITVTMAALAGTIQPASIAVSQAAAHPIGPHLTELKARMHAAVLIKATGLDVLTTDSDEGESRAAELFDDALRLYPVPAVEQCDQATCRRLAFIYGIAFHHPALNEATHLAIHELFGLTNLVMMNHLGNCAAAKKVIAADGADIYLPHLDRLQFPFTFLHGAKNLVWVPESTERTYDLLVNEFGPDNYRRYVFEDHGHGDCMVGAGASEDVYPRIIEHLERAGA